MSKWPPSNVSTVTLPLVLANASTASYGASRSSFVATISVGTWISLHEFAGLKPKGEVYGGWEKLGLSGHILGHYLSACSMLYAASGDERFLKRVNYLVDEVALCQKAHGNGYVGGVIEGKRIFDELAEAAGMDFGDLSDVRIKLQFTPPTSQVAYGTTPIWRLPL